MTLPRSSWSQRGWTQGGDAEERPCSPLQFCFPDNESLQWLSTASWWGWRRQTSEQERIMLSSSMGCSEIKLNLRKLEMPSCSRARNVAAPVCPRHSDSSGFSAELHTKLSCQLNLHFTSGEVSPHFLQQKKNSLLFLADAEMIHHKSSSFFIPGPSNAQLSRCCAWNLPLSQPHTWQQGQQTGTWLGQTKRGPWAAILHVTADTTALLDTWKLLT